jgi:dihydrofolate reductase
MGGIIATEHISLDGVVEAPGPGDIGDHPHKGWVFDFEPGKTGERYKVDEALAAEVLLLGRVTHETMAAFWPGFDGPFADKLNAMPKYVLSTTLERADWTDSTILRGDLVTEVTRLA